MESTPGSMHALIFDLDDTLYPEKAYVFSAYEIVADTFGERLGEPHSVVDRLRELFDSEHRHPRFRSPARGTGTAG